MATGEHSGCVVSGRILHATGATGVKTISIRPERGAMRGGIWYPPEAGIVEVDKEGKWSAVMLPSSVCGTYQVWIGRQEFVMSVPDAQDAAFDAIAQVLAVPRPRRS